MMVLGLLAASQSLLLFGRTMSADEAGVQKMTLTALGPGFYFWIGALVAPVVVGYWPRRDRSRPT